MGRVMSELVGDLLHGVGLGQVPQQPRSSQTAWGAIVSELCTSDPWQEGAEQAECPRFLPWEALSCKPVGLGRALELWALGRKGVGG